MNSPIFSYLTSQLLYQGPLIIACVVGLVLSIVFWARCPRSALLTLIATGVLLFTTVAILGAQTYLFSAQFGRGTFGAYRQLSTALALINGIVRALAFGTLMLAIFIGCRKPPVAPASKSEP